MKTPKPIQIFKPGKHVAMSGDALSFSETDLAATAAAYDPAKHEAPLVCGHPRHDAPAYGWVGGLSFAEGALEADTNQVDVAFAEMVAGGAFKKISASFYSPDSPSNPVPGVYYLRHVGFLGAQPPAVKGLRNPEFGDAEQGIVEFADYDDVDNASLWRNLREWIIGKFGQDEANKVLPGYTVQSLELGAQDELRESRSENQVSPAFADPKTPPEGDEMPAEDKARFAELEAENIRLKAEQVAFAEAETTRAAAARHAEHVAFAEVQVQAGKLLPSGKSLVVATLDQMASPAQAVEFGEGEAKQSLVDAFKAFVTAMPKQVEFAEVSGAKAAAAGVVNFAAPNGMSVDTDRLALHQKALAHQSANKTTYDAALAAVSV